MPTPRAIIPRTDCEPRARKGRFGKRGKRKGGRRFGTGRVQGDVRSCVPKSDTGSALGDRHRKMVTVCKFSVP